MHNTDYIFDAIVIGSGPSGTVCAENLVKKKMKVLMIDYGLKQNKAISKNQELSGVPLKTCFGSTFAYDLSNKSNIYLKNVDSYPSLAKGGLSNVWGGVILPYSKNEIENWPINYEDLAKYYPHIINTIGISGTKDNLIEDYPLFSSKLQKIKLSRQSTYLKNKLDKIQNQLNSLGVKFGEARLAMKSRISSDFYKKNKSSKNWLKYNYEQQYIFNSKILIDHLEKEKNFVYRNKLVAEKVIEGKSFVTVECKNYEKKISYKAKRIFIGAGLYPTSKIILNSIDKKYFNNRKIKIRDSQYFLFPALLEKNFKGVSNENLHTLAQLIIQIKNTNIDKEMINLQIYSFNDHLIDFLKKKFSIFYPLFHKFFDNFIFGRIIFIQGYLHSNSSNSAEIKINPINNSISVNEKKNKNTKKTIINLLKFLKINSKILGFNPLSFMTRIGNFGRGFHSGGSFPMHKSRVGFRSDKWGRPLNFKRVHCIDASVLPSVSSETITLTVMANALRIADNYKKIK